MLPKANKRKLLYQTMNYTFNKGSEWRIWDLHVHTPDSLRQHYEIGELDDKWENFITDLENLPSSIKVLGINDYIFIDGYIKVLKYKENGRLQNIDLILPVLEFRIKGFGGNKHIKRINFHVIFSDQLNPEIIKSQFLSSLTSKYILDPSITNPQSWNGTITKDSLADFGNKIKASIPQNQLNSYDSDLIEGFNNLNLQVEDVISKLKENNFLSNNYLLAIGKTEWDEFKWDDGSIAEKKDIINKVDFVFTSAETISNYQKAKEKLEEQKVNARLLDCSDAHYNRNSKEKDRLGNCHTWIKSDTTFEGLKQILHEFDDRVKVQEQKPDQKTAYNVIEKIKFINNSDNEKLITDFEIGLNPNLNTIIGGKSSGKSLMLHLLAEKLKNEIALDSKKKYTDIFKNIDVEIYYADTPEAINLQDNKRIIEFLPQLYIEQIVRDESNKEKFNAFIERLIKQSEEIDNIFSVSEEGINIKIRELEDSINNWINIDDEFSKKRNDFKKLGDKTAIENEISTIKKEIENLTKDANFSDDEKIEYNKLKEDLGNEENNLRIIEDQIKAKDSVLNQIDEITKSINEEYNKEKSEDSSEDFVEWTNKIEEAINNTNQIFSEKIELDKVGLFGKKGNVTKKIQDIVELQKKFIPKLTNERELERLEKKAKEENEKLSNILAKESEIAIIKTKRNTITFLNKYKDIYDAYFKLQQNIIDKVNEVWDDNSKGSKLKLKSKLKFNNDSFLDNVKNVINTKSYLSNQFENSGFDNGSESYMYDENHAVNIEKILNRVISDDNRFENFKGDNGTKELMHALLKNHFYIDYDIRSNDSSVLNMSEGKKGIVILQLYLSLSNADYPILIDQPEDNLDNRTVFKELNGYIKEAKKKRQIIMVSHNANLVVNTDAENIIVANQSGEDTERDNKFYKFEYVNGSLENTFENDDVDGILYQKGIREHVCEVLEGGVDAFKKREVKYNISR